MASGTLPTRPQAESAPAQGRYEDFIQKRLEQTRQQVRLADVASSLMLLAAGSLVFFLVVAVLDHWVFSHGLNFIARLGLFSVWVAGAGAFAWRFLLPSLFNRINPVFAAQTIEQTRPTLKNSLINFLLLRSHPQDVAPVVYRAMEHRAAADLLRVPADHAVERARIVHLAGVLAAAVAVFALYLALSPKNPLTSMARVLLPWSSVAAPTRVHIEDVKPGSDVVFSEERQEITAQVTGLRDGEEVVLVANTADNQVTEDRLVMTRTDDADHYRCELPAGGGGFQQDTFYHVTAGDATTQTYKLEVQIAPTIIVDRIDYHYPAYTEKADHSIRNQGDIKALEGTKVTIHATANMDIKEASIDLNCEGLQKRLMTTNGTKAEGTFDLTPYPDNEAKSSLTSYQILFTDLKGNKVRRPVRYNIDVERDLAPDIQFVLPSQPGTVNVPLDGQVTMRVRASDPDYALRRVTLHAARNGEELIGLPIVLDRVKPEKAFVGTFVSDLYIFRPSDFHLMAGDEVHYWATTDDNKEPRPNHSDTRSDPRNDGKPPRIIRIGSRGEGLQQNQPDQGQAGKGQQKPDGGKSEQGNGQPGKSGLGKGDSSKGQDSGAQNGQDGAESGKPGQGDSKRQNSKSPDKSGDHHDHAQPDNDSGTSKGDQPQDPGNAKTKGEKNSPDDGSKQPNAKTDPTTQGPDAVRKMIDDAQEQNIEQPNQSQQSEVEKRQSLNKDQGQDKANKPDGQQGSSPQNSPQQGGPQQGGDNQINKPQQGGQGGDKAPGKPDDTKNQQGRPSNLSEQGGGKPNSEKTAGQQPNSGQKGGGNNQPDQTSSQQPQGKSDDQSNSGTSKSGSPDSDSQPKGNNKAGQEPHGGQSGSPSNDNKDKASNSPGGSRNTPSGGGKPKTDTQQQAGSKPNSQPQSAGGDTKPGSQSPGGQDAKDQTANGSSPPNAETKKAGNQGGEEQQLAQNSGAKPESKKPSSGSDGSNSSPVPEGGDKPGSKPKEENGSSSQGGGKGSQEKKEQKEDGGGSSGGDKSKPGPGDQSGDGNSSDKKGGKNPSGDKGNSSDTGSHQQNPGGSGDPTSRDKTGTPDSQGDSHSGDKSGNDKEGSNSDKAKSPGISSHDSESSSSNPGSNNGGAGAGGGQASTKNGKGAAGGSMPAKNGGEASKEKGPGATGEKSGQEVRASERKGSSQHDKGQGNGNGEKRELTDNETARKDPQKSPPDSKQSNNSAESKNPSTGGQPGNPSSQQSSDQGSGQPAGGRGSNTAGKSSEHQPESGPDAADIEFSKKQVDLALNHLKDQLAKQKPELLDKLGWTKEEGQKFLDNLQKLKDSAQKPGSEGAVAKKEYNEFLKNLDLHPHGTRIDGGKTKTDTEPVRDNSQMQPPADWADGYHAYSRGTAGGK